MALRPLPRIVEYDDTGEPHRAEGGQGTWGREPSRADAPPAKFWRYCLPVLICCPISIVYSRNTF